MEAHPLADPVGYIKDVHLPETKKGNISRAKSLDFHIALEECKDLLPGYLLDYFQKIPWQKKRVIAKRLNEIANVKLDKLQI